MNNIITSLLLALSLGMLGVSGYSTLFAGNEVFVLRATSKEGSDKNVFYVNNKEAGDAFGTCVIVQDEQYVELSIEQEGRHQFIPIDNGIRMVVHEAYGPEIGLQVEQLEGSVEELQKQYNCERIPTSKQY